MRANSGDKPTPPNLGEATIATIHGTKYRIFLDHPILNDHGVFYPRGKFSDNISQYWRCCCFSDTTKPPNYFLSNIELEYSCVYSKELAIKAASSYQIGNSFTYQNISSEKTFVISKPNDGIINQQVNLLRRSMTGLLLLFRQDTAGSIDSEKIINPDIISVKVTINGMPNRIFSKGMELADFWEMVKKRFSDHLNNNVNQKDFYASSKYGLWIDMRTFPSNSIHGGGLKLDNTLGGIQLVIKRKLSGSGNIICYLFVVADAVMDVMNSDLHSISY